MTPTEALTKEPRASWWLRRIAPVLILLGLSALILTPSVIYGLVNPPASTPNLDADVR